MEYSQAKKLREKSLGTLLAEQEGGAFSSLKKAASLKTQAKMTGIQEKFDPMNIAKFMTMGSNWAPAMLGKLTNRKQSSVDYFSGVKRNHKGKGIIEKLASSPGEDDSDLLGILHDIESLLHKTREDDKLKSEEEKNFEEEKISEKARRHKELMEAITGKKYTEKIEPTATKEETEDNTPGLFDKIYDKVLSKLTDKFSKWFALAEVLGGTTLPVLGSVYAALLAPWLLNAYQRSEIEKDPNNPEWKDTPYAKVVRGEAETQGAAAAQNQRSVVSEKSPQYIKDLLAANPKFTDDELVEETGKNRKELEDWISTNPKTNLKVEQKPKITAEKINSKAKVTTPPPSTESDPTVIPTDDKSSTPPSVNTPNTSVALNNAQKENLELNLPQSNSNPDPSTIVNNNVNNVSKNGKPRGNIPLVRNNEETIQRLIFNSTRVV